MDKSNNSRASIRIQIQRSSLSAPHRVGSARINGSAPGAQRVQGVTWLLLLLLLLLLL
jgi:hypothetical protein